MGPGQNFLTRVGLGQPFIVLFGFVFGKFPLKMSNFFNFDQKKYLRVRSKSTLVEGGLASYFLRVKSKLGLGQGPSLLKTSNKDHQTNTYTQFKFRVGYFFYLRHKKMIFRPFHYNVCNPEDLIT